MTRQQAIEIMKRWDAPGYSFDNGHEFSSFAKDNPKWWAALVRAHQEVERLSQTPKKKPKKSPKAPYRPRGVPCETSKYGYSPHARSGEPTISDLTR